MSESVPAGMRSIDELVATGRELLAVVLDDSGRQFGVKRERMSSLAQLPMVHGIAVHALRQGRIVLDLYEQGLTLEAMPLVRAAYEGALTASWLSDSSEATAAIYNKEGRSRRNLRDTMEGAVDPNFRAWANDIAHLDLKQIESVADTQAGNFKQLCEALQGVGNDGYALYRAMSAFCHPSASLADMYLTPRETEAGAALRIDPEQFDHAGWLAIAVASMIWAARARDVMLQEHPGRNYLRRLARDLGVPEVLRLTDAARAEEMKAEQARRKARWKGRRAK